jgi:HD-GYP domain-containing protein (c-di-GMP phosphodiesterase class II)
VNLPRQPKGWDGHHERYDGGGYPHQLKGEAIPLAARILAVADAYAAMVADRPYRKALTEEEAIAELQACRGSQFDPRCVDAFIAMFRSAGESAMARDPGEASTA